MGWTREVPNELGSYWVFDASCVEGGLEILTLYRYDEVTRCEYNGDFWKAAEVPVWWHKPAIKRPNVPEWLVDKRPLTRSPEPAGGNAGADAGGDGGGG
jgi:hypothetical protein